MLMFLIGYILLQFSQQDLFLASKSRQQLKFLQKYLTRPLCTVRRQNLSPLIGRSMLVSNTRHTILKFRQNILASILASKSQKLLNFLQKYLIILSWTIGKNISALIGHPMVIFLIKDILFRILESKINFWRAKVSNY